MASSNDSERHTDDHPGHRLDRRDVLTGGMLAGAGATALTIATPATARSATSTGGIDARELGLKPAPLASTFAGPDQSRAFQRAVDKAASAGRPLLLPPGRFLVSNVALPTGAHLIGSPGLTTLEYGGAGSLISAHGASNVRLDGVTMDGASRPLDPARADGLVATTQCLGLTLAHVTVTRSLLNGISLRRCRASVTDATITDCGNTGIFALDGQDSRIDRNLVERCGNNGIQIWRSDAGDDGTVVTGNIIRHIKSSAGGDGQNGNGINVYRAGNVQVNANRITDCVFTAIRGNAASNIQMVGNHCLRLGEVALYAEFGFEGALIANNLIDSASTGISVTNFNDGGRLAVVQGNLVRNLTLRRHEDARGIGIGVEADTAVIGNVIENAPTIGIAIGWGRYMRDVTATSNIVRQARIGIGISGVKGAGPVFVTNNMLSGTTDGAIRMMDHSKPLGPDLARAEAGTQTNFTVFGNVSA